MPYNPSRPAQPRAAPRGGSNPSRTNPSRNAAPSRPAAQPRGGNPGGRGRPQPKAPKGAKAGHPPTSHIHNNHAPDPRRGGSKTVGHYSLNKKIGEGTFGQVRAGTHLITGEKVAVKILEKSRIIEVADVKRVTREIKILKRNRHRNIIQLFQVIDTPTTIYLIMENADGGE
ncbi:hypothetical protein TeGR_g778, partial [Tetraparma gracilis]